MPRKTLLKAERDVAVSDLAEVLATKHMLGEKDEIMRQLRYFTSEGLLKTVGAIHTGSGRRRLYAQSALIKAVVLLRLFQSGATVGLIKDYIAALEDFTLDKYKTTNLLDACKHLKRPTIYLVIPDKRYKMAAGLFEKGAAATKVNSNVDYITIQMGRFL
jgi:hypothetical protein